MLIYCMQLSLKLLWNGKKSRIKGPYSFTYPINIYYVPNTFQVERLWFKNL